MSTTDNDNNVPDICANCGKGEESSNSLKACTACKLVKYCSRDCQIAHRPQHKKECKKKPAELHDEELFKPPPPKEDCPICMIRVPSLHSGSKYYACCGKLICSGCVYAPVYDDKGNIITEVKCPFCRTPTSELNEEIVKRNNKRVELNDYIAIYNRGCDYADGECGFPQDYTKALELWHQAGELGSDRSYYQIGTAYSLGEGVKEDKKKAKHYWELAAMKGHVMARHNLGSTEALADNMDRALRHYMIATRGGMLDSLNLVRMMYSKGDATKDDYTTALRAYQEYLDEIKSDQRDKAAAANENYKYY